MPALTPFHEVRFPTAIAFGSAGGPERLTEVVTLGSGHEERNSRWADSRRRYNAGYGVRSIDDLHAVIGFFEERRGRLYGFRWRDRVDFSSAATPGATVAPTDQTIGNGDGTTANFQLVKTYGALHAPYQRTIAKPESGTVRVAVDGIEQTEITDWTCDITTGLVTFQPGSIPAGGTVISAGFAFDVPVRFDTDRLDINLASFAAGDIPSIPLVEIRL
ncbi:phage distal tail protein, Rcc01695 family [Bauldia sp.]|uniref:phage distal tail protein, Rcc01695 family n=1 Tax=Bauldia sp. TaxID=2575872 RepID=UPI003BACDE2C